jgi:protein-S-isoprenylcysteine O-methyltransferase Ste14
VPSTHSHVTGEAQRNHTIQIGLFIFFIIVWVLDSFIFRFTTFASLIPFFLNVITGIVIILLAGYLMSKSHIVFERPDPHVVDYSLYAHVRHPMYLGSILLYVGFWLTTLSILSLLPLLCICIGYNYLASAEERMLEAKFGNAYLDYKKRVRKWIPR